LRTRANRKHHDERSAHQDRIRHGPYWQYTRKINSKTVTRRLTGAQAAQYADWISNGRALRDLLAQMQQVSDQARDMILTTPQEDRQPGR
jgi:hypothetical protein